MKNIINFIIKEDDNNKRVDTILANHDKSLSRTRVKNLILDSKLKINEKIIQDPSICLLYTSPSPRDPKISRMPSSA